MSDFQKMSCCSETDLISLSSGDNVCRSCGSLTVGDIWGAEEQQAQFDQDVCRQVYVSQEQLATEKKLQKARLKHNMTPYIHQLCNECKLPEYIPDAAEQIYEEYILQCGRIQSPEKIAVMGIVISCHKRGVPSPVRDPSMLSEHLIKLCRYLPHYDVYFDILEIPGKEEYLAQQRPLKVEKYLKDYVAANYSSRYWLSDCISLIVKSFTSRKRIHNRKLKKYK